MNNTAGNKQSGTFLTPGWFRMILSGAIAVISACSLVPIAGSGTEEGNPGIVTGRICNTQDEPVSGAMVKLLPGDYNPVRDAPLPDSFVTLTDRNGNFRFSVSSRISFNIYAIDVEKGTKSLHSGISVAAGNSITVRDTLLETGYVTVRLPDSVNVQNGYLYIPGTPLHAFINTSTGFIVFNFVPAGMIPSINYNATNSSVTQTIRFDVHVAPGDTARVDMPAWKYAKKMVLNTAATGADVAGTVTDFPVLIRLTAANFTFSQAAADGRDIRFTKPDNTPLPFEIERWNAASQVAEVWVKVDTIFGNDSTHSIIMHYGNPNAASESNGATVFDTSNGFQGVWHLGEASGSNAVDATGNGYYGVPSPSSPLTIVSDFSMGKRFDGRSQYITMPNTANSKLNFPENGVYCISAWVAVYTTNTPRQVIVSKGNTYYSLEIQDTNRWAFTEFKDLAGWEIARSSWKEQPWLEFSMVKLQSWTLVTAIRSGDRQFLYLDGELCRDTANHFIASVNTRFTGSDLSIGRVEGAGAQGPCYFRGEIDEVRISRVMPSRDWITLSVRNQKKIDKLVAF